jgi:hypothetical protein
MARQQAESRSVSTSAALSCDFHSSQRTAAKNMCQPKVKSATVGLVAGEVKLVEPGEHDVFDILDAGVALCDLFFESRDVWRMGSRQRAEVSEHVQLRVSVTTKAESATLGSLHVKSNLLNQGNTMCSMYSMQGLPSVTCCYKAVTNVPMGMAADRECKCQHFLSSHQQPTKSSRQHSPDHSSGNK